MNLVFNFACLLFAAGQVMDSSKLCLLKTAKKQQKNQNNELKDTKTIQLKGTGQW